MRKITEADLGTVFLITTEIGERKGRLIALAENGGKTTYTFRLSDCSVRTDSLNCVREQ